jgi:hypothetical protein
VSQGAAFAKESVGLNTKRAANKLGSNNKIRNLIFLNK